MTQYRTRELPRVGAWLLGAPLILFVLLPLPRVIAEAVRSPSPASQLARTIAITLVFGGIGFLVVNWSRIATINPQRGQLTVRWGLYLPMFIKRYPLQSFTLVARSQYRRRQADIFQVLLASPSLRVLVAETLTQSAADAIVAELCAQTGLPD